MANQSEIPPPPPQSNRPDQDVLIRFAQTVQLLTKIGEANDRCAIAVDNLFKLINHKDDGLVRAIDDLIDEMQHHRKEMMLLRTAIAAMPGISLFGKR